MPILPLAEEHEKNAADMRKMLDQSIMKEVDRALKLHFELDLAGAPLTPRLR